MLTTPNGHWRESKCPNVLNYNFMCATLEKVEWFLP